MTRAQPSTAARSIVAAMEATRALDSASSESRPAVGESRSQSMTPEIPICVAIEVVQISNPAS